MSEREEYFNYVANVLGVKSLYLEASEISVTEHIPLLISVESLSNYNAEEKDLLEKIVAALKIDLTKIKIVDLKSTPVATGEYEILFLDDLTKSENAPQKLVTLSPRVLVQKPLQKKQVWNDLQKVILYFSK